METDWMQGWNAPRVQAHPQTHTLHTRIHNAHIRANTYLPPSGWDVNALRAQCVTWSGRRRVPDDTGGTEQRYNLLQPIQNPRWGWLLRQQIWAARWRRKAKTGGGDEFEERKGGRGVEGGKGSLTKRKMGRRKRWRNIQRHSECVSWAGTKGACWISDECLQRQF